MEFAAPNTVLARSSVRQWRDFLDVLLFARQNRCELVVPDQFPGLNALLEIKGDLTNSVEVINHKYKRLYKDLRAYRGDFDNISSLLVLQKMKVSSGRNYVKPAGQRTLCYTSNNVRNGQLEMEANFLAIALYNEEEYVGTKVFMKDHMIELLSL